MPPPGRRAARPTRLRLPSAGKEPTSGLGRALEACAVLVFALALFGFLVGVNGDSRFRTAVALTLPRVPEASVVETERDGVLRVLVVGSRKQPLPAARVRLFWERQRSYFDAGQGLTNAEGWLALSRVPRGRVWVLAEADGRARASTQLIVEGGSREVTLELYDQSRLSVRVTDEAHAALANATVLVTSSDPLPFGALTDAAGVALLDRLGAAPFSVKASAPGYESVSRSGVSGSIELALRRLGSLSVHVTLGNGEPAPGARLEIGGASLWPARGASADAAGNCKIAGLLAGSYDLRASKDSLVSRVLLGFLLERGEDKQLTLVLEPGRFVSALVTDGVGPNPHVVANADVVLAEEGLSTFPLRGRSGADGKLTLGPISNGPATLSGRAPDFVGNAVVAVPELLDEPVVLPLLRGGTLTGEVVDARGFPVEGASIEIIGQDSAGLPISETPQLLRFRRSHFAWALAGPAPLIAAGELGVMPGPIPPIPGSNAALAASALEAAPDEQASDDEIAPWISGAAGRFRAAPVSPGRIRALVRHPDFVEAVSDAITLTPGAEANVKITLLRGGSLEGRVRDEHDKPVENAEVEVLADRGTFQRATVTASDGSFAFSSLPREVTVNVRRAENPSRIAKHLPVTVEEGAQQTLEITLPALRDAIEISVLDDQGRPLELCEVNALSLDPSTPLRSTLFSDAAGKLSLPDAKGLELRLTAQAPGFARQALVLSARDARDRVELHLERGVLVHGRITALRGRRSVEGARVTLSSQGLRKTATTNGDGEYTLADVSAGPARLQVSHPDFAETEVGVSVASTGRSDRAFELGPVDLEEPGSVEGEVRDERGDPVAGARVAIGRAPSYLPVGTLPRGVAISDAQGAFSLRGLPSGVATIDAFAPDHGRGSARVEVQSNRTQSGVRINLQATGADQDAFAEGGVAVTLGERGSAESLEVVVVTVAEGSEAERGGLAAGDVITAVNDAKPSSMRDARNRLSGPLRSDVIIAVSRNGSAQRLVVARETVRK